MGNPSTEQALTPQETGKAPDYCDDEGLKPSLIVPPDIKHRLDYHVSRAVQAWQDRHGSFKKGERRQITRLIVEAVGPVVTDMVEDARQCRLRFEQGA